MTEVTGQKDRQCLRHTKHGDTFELLISSTGRLVYNRTSRATQFPDGVDVRVPGFGETFSLEFLDPSKRNVGM